MSAGRPSHRSRRRFLRDSSMAFVAGGVAMGARSEVATSVAADEGNASIVLLDPNLAAPDALHRMNANGAQTILLQGDPVRLWRSEQGAVLRSRSSRLLGVTNWPDLLIFRGLAAETRRHLHYEKFDAASGAFIWLLA